MKGPNIIPPPNKNPPIAANSSLFGFGKRSSLMYACKYRAYALTNPQALTLNRKQPIRERSPQPENLSGISSLSEAFLSALSKFVSSSVNTMLSIYFTAKSILTGTK